MKEYKNSNELLDYIISKGVSVNNKEDALYKIKTYSYYSIINTYKDVFKNVNNEYKKNVSFDEIYALFEFDKNLRSIFLKYLLEIEMILKSLLAETLSSRYGIKEYLIKENFDNTVNETTITESIDVIEEEINKQNGKHEAVTHYINEYGFFPKDLDGSTTTYECDHVYYRGFGINYIMMGSATSGDDGCGIFALAMHCNSSYTGGTTGTSPSCKPLALT